MPAEKHEWTIETELCDLANVGLLREALLALKIIDGTAGVVTVQEVDDWFRAGSETYLYTFRVITADKAVHLALKACVAYAPSSSVHEILNEWVSRRKIIHAAGILTPHLFAASKGVVLEEFIPYSVGELLASRVDSEPQLIVGLLDYARVLYENGFQSISPFNDLRSRGTDVVPIDFGEDLGPARAIGGGDFQIPQRLLDYLARHSVPVTPPLMAMIRSLVRT